MCHFVPFSHIPLKRDNGLIISPAIEGGSVQMHLLSSQLGGARALKTHFNEIWRELLATNQCIIDNRDLCADYNDCYGWWSECAEYFREYLYLVIHNHLYLPLSSFSIDDSFFDNICQLVPSDGTMVAELLANHPWKHPNPKQVPASISTSTSYKTECNRTDFIAIVH